jgi:hypothetical protein
MEEWIFDSARSGIRSHWYNKHNPSHIKVHYQHLGEVVHFNGNDIHCFSGPAIEYDDGREPEYWIFGKRYPKKEFDRLAKLKTFW